MRAGCGQSDVPFDARIGGAEDHRAVTSPTEGLKYTVENRQPDLFNMDRGGMELQEWEFTVFDLS